MAIEVEILADSVTSRGHRLTTFKCRYWRAILAEVNTHRMLSRNSPSSRAIPVARMVQAIINDPAIPVAWPKNQAGMQSVEDMNGVEAEHAKRIWLNARDNALWSAGELAKAGVHKQVANRLLEPWMWATSLLSGTDWENFFHLRVDKDAQPDFQRLAYLMLKAYLESKPKLIPYRGWHLPFGDKVPSGCDPLRICTGRAARLSYLTHDGEMDGEKDLAIADKLLIKGHWSPAEHVAEAVDTDEYVGNFQGWRQYRKFFGPRENRRGDLRKLLESYEAEMGLKSATVADLKRTDQID